jgi:hypothetical protein
MGSLVVIGWLDLFLKASLSQYPWSIRDGGFLEVLFLMVDVPWDIMMQL